MGASTNKIPLSQQHTTSSTDAAFLPTPLSLVPFAVAAAAFVFVVVATVAVAGHTSFTHLSVPALSVPPGPRRKILVLPSQHLAYCRLPKVASTEIVTYMAAIRFGLHTPKDVYDRHGDRGLPFEASWSVLGKEWWKSQNGWRLFTVVRHPGTRLYSAFFDKLYSNDIPDLLRLCNGDKLCSFETFVDGLENEIKARGAGNLNEHIRPQSILCNPRRHNYRQVFRYEDGVRRVQNWLQHASGGYQFDWNEWGDYNGHEHRSDHFDKLFALFPASALDVYEAKVPLALQWKIYRLYRADFEVFGYDAPTPRATQLRECPKLPNPRPLPPGDRSLATSTSSGSS